MNKLKIWKNDEGFCPVYLTEKGTKVVNGRELWQALGLKKDFSSWMKQRIAAHNLNKNDFFTFTQKVEREVSSGASVKTEYIIKLESAKHIAMATMTEAGERVRDYFIWCEEVKDAQLNSYMNFKGFVVPADFPTALRELAKAAEDKIRLELENAALAPKGEFYDTVTQSDDELDMNDVAKVLNLGFGRNILFQRLREMGVLQKGVAYLISVFKTKALAA